MDKTEEVLQWYADGKVSTERLAELLGVNYYVLHNALRKGVELFEPHGEAMEVELAWRRGEETPDNVKLEPKPDRRY